MTGGVRKNGRWLWSDFSSWPLCSAPSLRGHTRVAIAAISIAGLVLAAHLMAKRAEAPASRSVLIAAPDISAAAGPLRHCSRTSLPVPGPMHACYRDVLPPRPNKEDKQ